MSTEKCIVTVVASIVIYVLLQSAFSIVHQYEQYRVDSVYEQYDHETVDCVQNMKRLQFDPNDLGFAPTPQLVFIGIVSAPRYVFKRDAMRASWLNASAFSKVREFLELQISLPFHFEYKFFVAITDNVVLNQRLEMEAAKYGDMVILRDFIDGYYKLTLKTAAMMMYVSEQTQASLVLKCDDDSFVRLDMFVSSIITYYSLDTKCPPSRQQPSKRGFVCIWTPRPFIFGRFILYRSASTPFGLLEIQLNISNHLPLNESIYGFHPRAPQGTAYMLSRTLVDAIAMGISQNQLRFLQAEDLSMGVWIHTLFISKHFTCGVDHISAFSDLIIAERNIQCHRRYMALHYVTPERMVCLWDNLRDSLTATIELIRAGRLNLSLSQTLHEFEDWCC
jgi:hypothetical protein